MKKKLLCFLCLLTLLFAAACNKEGKTSEPTPTPAPTETPTPTPSPTPVPENLAKVNLEKIPAAYDAMIAYQKDHMTDTSNGIGYDMELEVTVNESLMGLIGYSELKSISLTGSVDYKDVLAGNFLFSLNDTEILNMHVFTDYTNVLFNLPKYSSQYAITTLEELLGSGESEDSTSIDNIAAGTGLKRTINTVDKEGMPSNEELLNFFGTYLTRFVECFEPQSGIESNMTIGTGDYIITGDKHTVIATTEQLQALVNDFQAEAQKYGLTTESETFTMEGATCLTVNYYAGTDGNYAWEVYSDNADAEPAIFVYQPTGFCLYTITDGTDDILMYSISTTEKEGTIYIPATEEETAESTIEYEYDDTSYEIYAILDTMELTAEGSTDNETTTTNFEIVVEGMSILFEETASKEHADAELTIASYGMKIGTLSISMDLRDYVEIPVPENTTDMETWMAGLDMESFYNDLLQLMEEYPFLADLFNNSEDDAEDDDSYSDDSSRDNSSYELPAGYSDDFMGMTGYYVDADGYVDFTPSEDEVLALGKPSTGLDTVPVTEDQKQALIACAENAFENYYSDIDHYYSVWGSTEYGTVYSYYSEEYYFSDNNSYDNFIFLEFDAVSGDFASISIYAASEEAALQLANEVFDILNVDYTITAGEAEQYPQIGDFWVSGYNGGSYYNISLEVWIE